MSSISLIPNICNPLRCLLGYIDNESLPENNLLLLRLALYYAKKSITMQWKSSAPSTIAFWLTLIYKALRYTK